jgi:xylulokinase
MEDYILWRLSGVAATDYSVASRTMLLDQERGDWWPEMVSLCGIGPDVLPRPLPSGTIIGHVTRLAAHQTGLAAGTPVATGGHDHLCGALAVGAVETGRFLDSSGTAQSLLMPVESFHGGGAVFAHGLSCYRHVLRNRFMIQAGLNTAGGALEWLVTLTSGDSQHYSDLFREAEASGPGARGITCLPYFRGCSSPYVDLNARGAFIGLTLLHTRGDLMRAVIEGLAYHVRQSLEMMAQVGHVAEGHILAIGGANREPLVLQTKADVCNRPVYAPSVPEASAVGAALLAGLAVGMFPDERAAAASVATTFQRYEPDSARARKYEAWYNDVYTKLYPALREIRGRS